MTTIPCPACGAPTEPAKGVMTHSGFRCFDCARKQLTSHQTPLSAIVRSPNGYEYNTEHELAYIREQVAKGKRHELAEYLRIVESGCRRFDPEVNVGAVLRALREVCE